MSKKMNWNWKIGRFYHLIFHLKSSISARYDITRPTAPVISTLKKGQMNVYIPLSEASKTCNNCFFLCFFPIFFAHVSGFEFHFPDLKWKELCGQMANLVAESGGNKGQLSHLVEAICSFFSSFVQSPATCEDCAEILTLVIGPPTGSIWRQNRRRFQAS